MSDRTLKEVFTRVDTELKGDLVEVPITADLSKVLKDIEVNKTVGLDFEWDGEIDGKPHSVGLATFNYAIGLEINEQVKKVLLKLFHRSDIQIVGHNILADIVKAFDLFGMVNFYCEFLDTMVLVRELASHIFNDSQQSLEYFAYYHLLTEPFKHSNDINFFKEPSELLCKRTAGDAWTGVILAEYLFNRYRKDWIDMDYAMECDMDLLIPAAHMIYEGITVDPNVLNKFQKDMRGQLAQKYETLYQQSEINPNSHQQLKHYLNDTLELNILNTTEATLNTVEHPFVTELLEYKKLNTLNNKYLSSIPEFMDNKNRIHPQIFIPGTITGRLAYKKPPMQTIPPDLRPMFMSNFGEDGVLAQADASQSELRCLGYLSNSKPIIEAYEQGVDFHQKTADLAGITRRDAKTLNFGFIYGASESRLRTELVNAGTKKKDARKIAKNYMKTMDELGIKKFQDYTVQMAKRNKYVQAVTGRKGRRLSYTQVVNYPVQALSSDLNKRRMVQIYKEMRRENLASRIWLELHDAAHFDIYKIELDKVKNIIYDLDQYIPDFLKLGVNMKLPMEFEIYGSHWGTKE